MFTEYYLHNYKLTTVSKAKYLGVILDSKLSFNNHVDATCKKANSVLSFLRRNLRHCHRRIKIDAYNSFVRPILNYAAPVDPHCMYIYIIMIIHGLVELNLLDYIIPAPRITRGHTMKFVQPAMHTDQYKYSFLPNSISHWNKLPPETANIVNLNDFQNLLQSHM